MSEDESMNEKSEETTKGALGARVANGFRWSMLDVIVQQGARFGLTVILTRLLGPDDFGLLAMALVFTQLASLVGDLGLGPALVQRSEVTRQHVVTATTVTFLAGLLFTAVLAALAYPIASFYEEPELQSVLLVLSATYLLRGLAGVPRDLMRRSLRFDLLAIAGLASVFVSGGVGLALALNNAGVWALVAQVLVESLMATVLAGGLAWKAGLWRLGFGFDKQSFRQLAGFGAFVSGTRIAGYGSSNIDNLIVGKVLGAASLGLYNLAYRLMLFPILKVADVVASVTMPAMSALQDDLPRMALAHRHAIQATAILCLPLSFGIAIAAPALVPAVFGMQWVAAVAAVQILALNGVRLALGRLNGSVYQATGKPKWDFYLVLATFLVYVVTFSIAVQYGITGMAWGFTIAGYLLFPLDLFFVTRALHTKVSVLLGGLKAIALATVLMSLSTWLTMSTTTGWGSGQRALVVVAAATVVYLSAVQCLAPNLIKSLGKQFTRR